MPREHTFSSPKNVGVLFNIMIDVSGSLTYFTYNFMLKVLFLF